MTTHQHVIFAAIAFAGGLLPGSVAAQSYGGGDQVLTVAASSFHTEGGCKGFIDPTDGYLYLSLIHI